MKQIVLPDSLELAQVATSRATKTDKRGYISGVLEGVVGSYKVP